jgi:hypothetical protein
MQRRPRLSISGFDVSTGTDQGIDTIAVIVESGDMKLMQSVFKR